MRMPCVWDLRGNLRNRLPRDQVADPPAVDAKADIVIAGGGIGGVIAAELLARARRRVLVLERSIAPPPFLRPEIIWPSAAHTLFNFHDRIAWETDSLLAVGGLTVHFGGNARPVITRELLRTAGLQPFFTDPNQLRERLLADCTGEVRRGIEVIDVIRNRETVRGVSAREIQSGKEFVVEADVVVGDDGPESRIRSALGIEMKLRRFPVDFFVREHPWPEGLPGYVAHALIAPREDRSGLYGFGFVPVPGKRTACVAAVRGNVDGASPDLSAAWNATLSAAGDFSALWCDVNFPNAFSRVSRKWGHVARYGEGNAVLIGDAAHPVSPAGGQGANMAIADAVMLARVIMDGANDLARALDSIRRAPNSRGLRPTRLAHRVFEMSGSSALRGIPRLILPRLLTFPALFPRILRTLATGSANPDWERN